MEQVPRDIIKPGHPAMFQHRPEPKHSGPGILSCITAVVSLCFLLMLVVTTGVMEVSTPGGLYQRTAGIIIVFMLILAGIVMTVAALLFGVSGLLQDDKKKRYAVLGTILSTVILIGIGILMALGYRSA